MMRELMLEEVPIPRRLVVSVSLYIVPIRLFPNNSFYYIKRNLLLILWQI